MKKILTVSASNSKHSINRTLLELASSKIEGHEVALLDIRDYQMPFFSLDREESEGHPETAKQVRALFAEYDAFIISSPEHNGSIPAEFKNLIDWVSRLGDLQNPMFATKKPVLLLSASPGPNGGATNVQTLTKLMPWWGADVKGSFSLGSFYDHFVDGKLNTEKEQELTNTVTAFINTL
ncbi:NAD(P)H-dependent oxidoreductase [uncultured Paraglaciecola sp.]|uniref:NADPH-dependent FMN reductase n=1 Tax=uncultured Paraglaciecola sp. TaxID=1765024 RepID=UPI0030D77D1D|tara:strand:+ start:2892 stop:3431 length:540 start_codon:yes stop_codon:yes gene_type:complete